jgi:coatomer subunit beta'
VVESDLTDFTDLFFPRISDEKGQNNLAFATLFQLGDASGCVDLLIKTQRAPEAAMFARTYAPRCVLFSLHLPEPPNLRFGFSFLSSCSQVPKAVDAWRTDLRSKNRPKIATSIAHPAENADLFEEGWADALGREATSPSTSVNGASGQSSA